MIRVHNDATDDLHGIKASDIDGFNRLVAFIQQLRADPNLKDKLLDHGYGEDRSTPISVKKWISALRVERVPVWRLRMWDLEQDGLNYRIIYCYNWQDRSYNIMAIVHRDELDYDDPNHPIRKRVTARVKQEFPLA